MKILELVADSVTRRETKKHTEPKTESAVQHSTVRVKLARLRVYRHLKLICAMKNLCSSLLRVGLVVLAVWLSFTSPAKAQCPGSSGPPPDPSICAWTGPYTDYISMGGDPLDCNPPSPDPCTPPLGCYPHNCCIKITYCLRCCGNVAEAYLESFQPWNSKCDPSDPVAMFNYAANYIRDVAVTDCGIQPCTKPALQISVYTPSCWSQASPSGQYIYSPCSLDSCYCERSCSVCDSAGKRIYSNCNTRRVGSCTCSAVPDPGTPWLNGTCYLLPCP